MNRLVLAITFLFLSIQTDANHFTGSYINYEHISGSLYRVNLYLYKTCESSAIDLPSFTKISLESALNNTEIFRNLPRVKVDTLNKFCSGTTTSCKNLSSQYPGYIIGLYSDTITVPFKAKDWLFTLSNGGRSAGMTNIASSSSQNFYVESSLDNTLYNNSNTIFPTEPPNTLFVNDSITVPMNGYDPDGDRVEYAFVSPASEHQTSVGYYSGYSVSQPFGTGGLCYFDTNNNVVFKSPAVGKYTIAIRVREYRGTRLMSESLLDFVIICSNATSGNVLSIPLPTNNDNKEIYTCPGKSNTINFNFVDPISTDQVTMNIEPPNISGWNFSTSTNNGTGAATGSISWKTPTSLNPIALPLFYIKVHVKDNGCKLIGEATYIYRVNTESCFADSVWPGDANSDKIVDLYDPLAIAMNYGDTGIQRINPSTNWVGQSCDYWDHSFLNNIDVKHSDCNGDGKVDTADLNVISMNYTKKHAKRGQNKTTGAYDLMFDHNGISPNPDSSVSIKILLNGTIQNLYGLAANISVSGISLTSAPTITYPNSWLGNNTNTLSFVKDINTNSIDWAYARNDKQNNTGQGQLASLKFTIPSNAQDGQMVILNYNKAKLIDKDGVEFKDFDMIADTFYISKPTTSVGSIEQPSFNVQLYPNPGKNKLTINISSIIENQVYIKIKDLTGKTVMNTTMKANAGNSSISLKTNALPNGMFLVEVSSSHGTTTNKWIKM